MTATVVGEEDNIGIEQIVTGLQRRMCTATSETNHFQCTEVSPAPAEVSMKDILKVMVLQAMLYQVSAGTSTKRARLDHCLKPSRSTPLITKGTQVGNHEIGFEGLDQGAVCPNDKVNCLSKAISRRKTGESPGQYVSNLVRSNITDVTVNPPLHVLFVGISHVIHSKRSQEKMGLPDTEKAASLNPLLTISTESEIIRFAQIVIKSDKRIKVSQGLGRVACHRSKRRVAKRMCLDREANHLQVKH